MGSREVGYLFGQYKRLVNRFEGILTGKVLTLSDSSGFLYAKDGLSQDQVDWIKELKNGRRERVSEAAREFGCKYYKNKNPWGIPGELVFPCATQNEIDKDDAEKWCDVVSGLSILPWHQGYSFCDISRILRMYSCAGSISCENSSAIRY